MNRKRTWKTLGLAALIFFSLVYASEETASERTMQKILEYKDKGFVNVRGERRGHLAKGGKLKQRIKMFKGQDYLAVVSGDEDIKDIKITIMDKKGKKLLVESSGKGSTAALEFKPEKKDKYSFFIETGGSGGYYHFSLITK